MTTVSSTSSTASTASTASTSPSSYSTSTSSTSANSSTVDWDGLIEAMVQEKLEKADTIDTQITNNQTKISAYQNLQTLLQDVTTKANALSDPSGLASDNVFNERAAYLTANGDVTASSVLSIDVDSGTPPATYDVEVSQIAKAEKVSSGAVADSTSDLGYSGVFSIGTTGGTPADITVTSDMSLADVAEAINDQSTNTGVQATVLQVSSTESRLVLTSVDTGTDISVSAVSGDDIMNKLGVTDSTGAFADQIQASQQAIMTLDGVQITRSTNDISDLISGVTFHLFSTTPADTSVSAQIAPNLTDIQTAIQNFVTSYNSLRDFVQTQTATTTDGTADSGAVLFGDGTLRSISSQLEDDLNSMVSSYSLGNLGISFDTDNKLEVDTTTLESELNNNLSDVQSLLSFNMTTSATDLYLLARGSAAPTNFTLDVNVDSTGAVTSASVGGDDSMFTVDGTRIIGNAGTPYDGFSFSFSGKASESINIALSYGIADRIYQDSDAVGDATSGTLTSVIENIEQQDSDLSDQSSLIKSEADDYRTTLTARYAQIQQQILTANSTISYLKLLSSSSSSSSSS